MIISSCLLLGLIYDSRTEWSQKTIIVRELIFHTGYMHKLAVDMVSSSFADILASRVDVFVEDLFMFCFVLRFQSKRRKNSNFVNMIPLIF